MAVKPGSGGGASGVRETRLKRLIDDWENLRSQIADLIEQIESYEESVNNVDPSGEQVAALKSELEELRQRRKKVVNDIQGVVKRNPGLRDEAIAFGFREDLLPTGTDTPSGQPAGTRSPSEKNVQQGTKGSQGKGGNEGPGGPGGRGGSTTPGVTRKLPKGYKVIRGKDGRIYLVWNAKYGPKGKRKDFPALWEIDENQLDQYGISKSEIKNVSGDAWARLKKNRFGMVGDIEFRGRHPIRAFIEEMADIYGIAPGLLRNREVMEVLFEAWMEEKDTGWITQRLRDTEWWQSKSKERRAWIFDLGREDRERLVNEIHEKAKQYAIERFGAVDWREHIDPGQLEEWAKKAAKGQGMWSVDGVFRKIDKQARGVVGTTAFVEWEAQTPGTPQDINAAFEQVRDASINWLGYFAKPHKDELNQWATWIATGAKTIDDFNQLMRKRKQDLYPWLSPDEGYLERAGSYKNVAERLLGTTIAWDDKALMDLTGRDDNGVSTGAPMTLDEYDKWLRKNDPRFWEGPVAREEGFGLINFLNEMFTGAPGGSLGG